MLQTSRSTKRLRFKRFPFHVHRACRQDQIGGARLFTPVEKGACMRSEHRDCWAQTSTVSWSVAPPGSLDSKSPRPYCWPFRDLVRTYELCEAKLVRGLGSRDIGMGVGDNCSCALSGAVRNWKQRICLSMYEGAQLFHVEVGIGDDPMPSDDAGGTSHCRASLANPTSTSLILKPLVSNCAVSIEKLGS